MQIKRCKITDTNISGQSTNVDISHSFFQQLRSQLCLTESLVVKKTGIGIEAALGTFINQEAVLGDLK